MEHDPLTAMMSPDAAPHATASLSEMAKKDIPLLIKRLDVLGGNIATIATNGPEAYAVIKEKLSSLDPRIVVHIARSMGNQAIDGAAAAGEVARLLVQEPERALLRLKQMATVSPEAVTKFVESVTNIQATSAALSKLTTQALGAKQATGALLTAGSGVVGMNPVSGGLKKLGSGSFSDAYLKSDGGVTKVLKNEVKGADDIVVTTTRAMRHRLAKMSAEWTNELSDSIGGGIIPKLSVSGAGRLDQAFVKGSKITELPGDLRSVALQERDSLVVKARGHVFGDKTTVTGDLAGPGRNYRVMVDDNIENFFFDPATGKAVAWFDPIAVMPHAK